MTTDAMPWCRLCQSWHHDTAPHIVILQPEEPSHPDWKRGFDDRLRGLKESNNPHTDSKWPSWHQWFHGWLTADAETIDDCGCIKCVEAFVSRERLVEPTAFMFPGPGVPHWRYNCELCGNKRCPHHSDHTLTCTRSNDTGQPGSIFT